MRCLRIKLVEDLKWNMDVCIVYTAHALYLRMNVCAHRATTTHRFRQSIWMLLFIYLDSSKKNEKGIQMTS